MKLEIDFKKIRVSLLEMADIMKNEWPFVISYATNKTAQIVKEEIKNEMLRVYKNPTPYTMRGLWMTPGDKSNPAAYVWMKGFPDKYQRPEVYGGSRRQKRSEVLLKSSGAMGNFDYYAPGKNTPLNSYGNISPGTIVQILSQTKSFWESGYNANISKRKGSRKPKTTYFAIRKQKGDLAPGIYKRVGEYNITRVLKFIRPPAYPKIFYFFKICKKVFYANINEQIGKAIKYCKLNPYVK